MEKKNLCPKCGSGNTQHISGRHPDYRVDWEVHPFLYRCMDCGEVFPGDGFPLPELPEEV